MQKGQNLDYVIFEWSLINNVDIILSACANLQVSNGRDPCACADGQEANADLNGDCACDPNNAPDANNVCQGKCDKCCN